MPLLPHWSRFGKGSLRRELNRLKVFLWPRRRAKWPTRLLLLTIGGLSSLAIAVLQQMGELQFLELLAYDSLVQLQPDRPLDSRLLIVGIDEEDIQQQRHWPLRDEVIAQALTQLQRDRPKIIALDLFREIPYPPGSRELRQALQAPNIIGVTQLPTVDNPQGIAAPPGIPPERIGFSDLIIDPDNIIRRALLWVQTPSGQQQFSAFALQTSRHYLGVGKYPLRVQPETLWLGSHAFPRLGDRPSSYQLPASETLGWQVILQYRSRRLARQVSLRDVLAGRVDPGWINNKIVLMGVAAPSAKDTFPTPYSAVQTNNFEMSGVLIHGQMISQILGVVLEGEKLLGFWPVWAEWLWLAVWALGGAVLVWGEQRPWRLGLAIALALTGLWVSTVIAFAVARWIPFVPPLFGFLLSGAVVLVYKVVYQASYDPLTGLPNRRRFLQHIQGELTQKSLADSLRAVLFLDLDRFKLVNDALGHSIGDRLLVQVTERLQNLMLGQTYYLARVGGDEFALWLSDLLEENTAITLADGIHQKMAEVFTINHQEIYLTVSIGIVFERGLETGTAPELLRYADIAMYRAKELGKARHVLFMSGMDQAVTQRWQLETHLRVALAQREFELYYQPIVNLQNLKLAGFEALIRWHSKDQGIVSPAQFIPIAEENGMIVDLGAWILEEACQQIYTWRQQFPHLSHLLMSINLSARQFAEPNLLQEIQLVLGRLPMVETQVKLEITESSMIHDLEQAITLLQKLKSLGLQLSIDDFGTGYSSLNYLYRFPLDTLKIDKSFIDKLIGDQSPEVERYIQLVQTIINLGHNLGMDVIAEGVETSEQVRILQTLHCEYGQGYLFSRPLAVAAATELLYRYEAGWQLE